MNQILRNFTFKLIRSSSHNNKKIVCGYKTSVNKLNYDQTKQTVNKYEIFKIDVIAKILFCLFIEIWTIYDI